MKYKVRTACEIDGVWRKEGAELELTEEQARYLAPPYGRVLTPAEDASASSAKKAGGK